MSVSNAACTYCSILFFLITDLNRKSRGEQPEEDEGARRIGGKA